MADSTDVSMSRGAVAGPVRTRHAGASAPESVSSPPERPRLKVAIYCDGANVKTMLANYHAGTVQGFTTNPTLMWQAGVSDYTAFAKELLAEIKDLPVSFEVFADDLAGMERQARLIASWGRNVFVKIPVTNTRGESTRRVITNLVRTGVKVNVTALLTTKQVEQVCDFLDPEVQAIISIFAGRIADTGRDPVPIMKEAVEIAKRCPHAKILWASPREVLNVYQADACGCHIVTATEALLNKLPLYGRDLAQLSRETVQMFYVDAQRAGYSL